jgi:hypothetical protein
VPADLNVPPTAAPAQPRAIGLVWDRLRDLLSSDRAVPASATIAGVGAFALYVATLLPGVSFGDWAEMQTAPALLEVPHPTGFPLLVLLGRLWLTLEPLGRVAWRMNLFSALVVGLASALAVLIAARLGARPVLALAGGLALAAAGTVWSEATVAEVNGLHLFMVTLLLWLAVRWRDELRDRWFLLGVLVGGLAISNHLLAIGALAILVPATLWSGRRRLVRGPWLIVGAAALGLLGLSLYLFIPIRVAISPPGEYPALRTFDGIWSHINGEAYRRDMHFLSVDTFALVLRELPALITYAIGQSNVLVVAGAAIGALVTLRRDPWAGVVLLGLAGVTLDLFVGYRGDLPHYLLVAWLVTGVWFALGAEWLARAVVTATTSTAQRVPAQRRSLGTAVILALAIAAPLAAGVSNYASHDLSGDRTGDAFVDEVFAALPQNAVLYTYWDAGEPLHYARCVEHRRTDLVILAPDDWVSFRPCEGVGTIDALYSGRPIYALAYSGRGLESIRGRYTSQYVATLAVPYGERTTDHTADLIRLYPNATGLVGDSLTVPDPQALARLPER